MLPDTVFLKTGWFVYIGDPLNGYYQITAREPFDYQTGEEQPNYATFTALAAGASSSSINIQLLEPDETPLHLMQAYAGTKDTLIKYYFKIDTGTNRWGVDLKKDIGFIDANKSGAYDPNPAFVMWLISDFFPAVIATNISPVTITPMLYFTGMKYDISPVTSQQILSGLNAGQIPCTRIEIGGISTSSGV